MKQEDRDKIVEWVKNHPDVVTSPFQRDTILCPCPTDDDPSRTVRKNKLLLQTSVRELHSDLFKPGTGIPEVVMKDGKKLISDTVFRQILPFELRPMTKHLKEVCCCKICETMKFLQDALNQWRKKKKKQLKDKWEQLPVGITRQMKEAKEEALHRFILFQSEGFVGEFDLHPSAKDAALSIQCDPPEGFVGSGLTKLCCALGRCDDCPQFARPIAELTATDPIKFFSFPTLPSCSRCGALDAGVNECAFCNQKKDPKQRGKVSRRVHSSVLKS